MEISFTRIGLLMKKQFIENKKLYLFGVLAIMGIMSFVFVTIVFFGEGLKMQEQGVVFGLGMISFGCLFTLTLFSKLDKKEGRTEIFTLPATALEKLVCGIIYGAILFPIIYIITVYPILRFAHYLDNTYMGRINETYIFNVDKAIFMSIFYILQTLVLMLSVFIKQYKVPISAGILSIIFLSIFYFYPKIIAQSFPREIKGGIKMEERYLGKDGILNYTKIIKVDQTFVGPQNVQPFGEMRYNSQYTYLQVGLPLYQNMFFYVLLLLAIPFLWIITWFKLKELEVN